MDAIKVLPKKKKKELKHPPAITKTRYIFSRYL